MGMVSPETMAQYAAKSGEKNPTGVDVAPTTKEYKFEVTVTVPASYEHEAVREEIEKLLLNEEHARVQVLTVGVVSEVN